MNRVLNMMTLDEMSELSGVPVKTLESRTGRLGAVCVEGRYRATAELLAPVSDEDENGLFTLSELGKRFGVTSETIRKRILVNSVRADYVLVNGTKLFRLTDRVKEVCEGESRKTHQPRHADPLEELSSDVRNMILQEREKKQWVGRRGVLYDFDTGKKVIAEGVIEHVSSCGVFVNGVQGVLKRLELAR